METMGTAEIRSYGENLTSRSAVILTDKSIYNHSSRILDHLNPNDTLINQYNALLIQGYLVVQFLRK